MTHLWRRYPVSHAEWVITQRIGKVIGGRRNRCARRCLARRRTRDSLTAGSHSWNSGKILRESAAQILPEESVLHTGSPVRRSRRRQTVVLSEEDPCECPIHLLWRRMISAKFNFDSDSCWRRLLVVGT